MIREKAQFLKKYVTEKEFEQSGCRWEELMAIASDYSRRCPGYEEEVRAYIEKISVMKQIHSYQYRIKEVDSLLRKIVKKTCEKKKHITVDNYREYITDLIGIRLLYVFKSDYYAVYKQLRQHFWHQQMENIHIKLREGDDELIFSKMMQYDPVIEKNSDYRSIHYTFYSNEKDLSEARVEIQTRTIFEEGWSEINHKLVYKSQNKVDDPMLKQASGMLSTMVGDCDKLGELMKNRALTI